MIDVTTLSESFESLSMIFIFTDITARKHKVLWEDSSLCFDHLPLIMVNHKVYDCQHGVDRHMNAKKRKSSRRFIL